MKLLCDQMLAGLGKWLRAAGYDTLVIETPITDKEIVYLAAQEQRYIITRDRHFLEMKEVKNVVWLESNTVEACVQELSSKLPVDWTHAPFSRCLQCNTPLERVEEEVLQGIPEGVKGWCHEYWLCRTCNKVYWLGSHTDSMLAQLKQWNML